MKAVPAAGIGVQPDVRVLEHRLPVVPRQPLAFLVVPLLAAVLTEDRAVRHDPPHFSVSRQR